jgi:hypothetical protein
VELRLFLSGLIKEAFFLLLSIKEFGTLWCLLIFLVSWWRLVLDHDGDLLYEL